MPIPLLKSDYRCSQDELYEVCDIIIGNLADPVDLAKFFAKKSKYTTAFVNTLKALRTTAMSFPDDDSRDAVHQTLKNLLPGLMIPVKDNFNDLKGYIRDGWPGEEPKPRYEAAGLIKYNDIGKDNWEAVTGLNQKMHDFIASFNAALTTPGGMPGTFAAKVDADALAFDTKYQMFMLTKETTTARNAKITADNKLYNAIMDVNKDGVEMVYRTDEGGRKRYTFSVVLKSVSPPGAASLKILAKHTNDTLVMDGNITIKQTGQPPKTVPITNGVGFFSNVAKGKYEGTIAETGNPNTTNFTKEVETGRNARVTVTVV